jgi:hypothetical protein
MSTVIIENLEVLNLRCGKMSWNDAMKLTEELGEDYRLPSGQELRNIIYPNSDTIPNLEKTEHHWTCYSDGFQQHIAFSQHPMFHRPEEENKQNLINVVLVRDVTTSVS